MGASALRLYLSSFRVGSGGSWLAARATSPVGVVLNAIDDRPADGRREAWELEAAALGALGLDCVEVDLRSERSARRLETLGTVWVRGGNTFLLRRRIAESGFEGVLRDRITSGELVYAGYSAGATVLCADLSYLVTVDDPAVAGADAPMRGLALLDRPFMPHVDSPGYYETAACTAISAGLRTRGVAHWALRDGQVLVCDGDDFVVLQLHRERPSRA